MGSGESEDGSKFPTPHSPFPIPLLCSLSRKLLSWLVSSLSAAGEFDLVTRYFPFVEKGNFVSLDAELDRKRYLVSADLTIGDFVVAPHSRYGSGHLFPFGLEVEGRFAGLAVTSWNLGDPFASHIRRPGQ